MPVADAKTEPKATITTRVYRAATDTWEEPVTHPATIEDMGDPATFKERMKALFGKGKTGAKGG